MIARNKETGEKIGTYLSKTQRSLKFYSIDFASQL